MPLDPATRLGTSQGLTPRLFGSIINTYTQTGAEMKYIAETSLKILFLVALYFIGKAINDFFVWISQVFNPGTRIFLGVNMNFMEGLLIFSFVIIPIIGILCFIFVPSSMIANKEAAK